VKRIAGEQMRTVSVEQEVTLSFKLFNGRPNLCGLRTIKNHTFATLIAELITLLSLMTSVDSSHVERVIKVSLAISQTQMSKSPSTFLRFLTRYKKLLAVRITLLC
jgi:hypothetical protein